ncbi:MAG: transglutaminase domain-containing protein [Sphaerochaeta sp.]|nr:transglutaminase domain-containing protein [Sphaerochaeta sp.]
MEERHMYLESSHLLDYTHPAIQQLIRANGWDTPKTKKDLIGEVYTFVRDEIAYGYTKSFSLSASKILAKGYGNCITKSTLLMALLRAVGVPCHDHTESHLPGALAKLQLYAGHQAPLPCLG